MSYVETLERILRSIEEGLEEAYENALTFLPEYDLMRKQHRVMSSAIKKMKKIQNEADRIIGSRRSEKISSEEPEKIKKPRRYW